MWSLPVHSLGTSLCLFMLDQPHTLLNQVLFVQPVCCVFALPCGAQALVVLVLIVHFSGCRGASSLCCAWQQLPQTPQIQMGQKSNQRGVKIPYDHFLQSRNLPAWHFWAVLFLWDWPVESSGCGYLHFPAFLQSSSCVSSGDGSRWYNNCKSQTLLRGWRGKMSNSCSVK